MPLVLDLLGGVAGTALDLGCGEGQVMRAVEADRVIGCDWSLELLGLAAAAGPVVRCRLPSLGWLRTGAVDHAYAVLVLEHLPAIGEFFAEAARVVKPGGTLVLVQNHPAYTPPGAGPIIDQSDGEVLWRWADYFNEAAAPEPAGTSGVTFHHRPLGVLLTVAAEAGWRLERLEERGLGPAAIARDPGMAGQEHVPRLLGVRWTRVEESREK